MAMKIRSAKEIKTLSSVLCSGVHLNERHVHEFKLGALELERARRARERQSAIRRIKDIDARLAEV
ncbi:MAG: hypothetical protein HY897_00965, partial [Deltaproteobacteria bacterium]|nr:hypothetical protein [Deltaproteobacteria bacterium]